MEAKELMIGDWVETNGILKYYKVYSIDTLTKGDACRLTFDDWNVDTWCDRVKPIPLTEEILKANGFEFDDIDDSWAIGDVKFYGKSEGEYWLDNYYGIITFKYVHELQHVLRLCGLNELADNFKVV